MNAAALAFAYLRRRWGQALLSILVGALGVASVETALIGLDALPRAARHAWGNVDLVVGPKGSALDLVLCCALHVADPRGLVSSADALKAVASPMVRAAAPIALGDNVDGWRIVGTTPALLDVYRARIAAGVIWRDKLQAVLGAGAARDLKLQLGDTFVGAHGLAAGGEAHDKFPYKVVGVMAPTGSVLDRLVLVDIETVRYVHVEQAKLELAERGATDEDEGAAAPAGSATAVLVSYRTPTAGIALPRQIDALPALGAASPSFEIARLIGYLRPLTTAATGFGILLVAIAAAAAAMGLMATLNARTRDLALLRALGAGRATLAAVAFSEAAMIAGAALVLGLVISCCLLALGDNILAEQTGMRLDPEIDLQQLVILAGGAVLVSMLAAGFPALRAATTEIEELLQS